MKKRKKIKHFNIKLLVLFASFFLGMNITNACVCYYGSTYKYQGTGIFNTTNVEHIVFYAGIAFNQDQDISIQEYAILAGSGGASLYKNNKGVLTKGNTNGLTQTVINKTVENNCQTNCSNIDFYVKDFNFDIGRYLGAIKSASGTITTEKTDIPLKHISESQANEFKNKKKAQDNSIIYAIDNFEEVKDDTTFRGDPDKNKDKIKTWGDSAKRSKSDAAGAYQGVTCSSMLSKETIKFIHNILFAIQVLGIIMLIGFTSLDFIKAIAASEDDTMKKAIGKLKNRIIAVIILLLAPIIVGMILDYLNQNITLVDEKGKETKVYFGDKASVFCGVEKNQ